jgi:hemerythrin-like domain-containing protein
MKAFDDLSHEHELIRRMITVLESLTGGVRSGRPGVAGDLREAVRFVRGFADKCHHGKEEKLLFPLIAGKNQTVAKMPVRILTSEHDAGRTLISEVERALSGLEAGDEKAAAQVAQAVSLYARMLRKHIDKEEDIVFPLAKTLISPEEADLLAEQFEALEEEMGEDAHELYRGIVESLEQRMSVTPAGKAHPERETISQGIAVSEARFLRHLNAGWHEANPMPRNPTLDQRIEWHTEHQKYCSCRPIPDRLKAEVERRQAVVRHNQR